MSPSRAPVTRQHRVGDHVAGDDQLQAGAGGVQVGVDGRGRDVDHGGVQHRHELPGEDDGQQRARGRGPAARPAVGPPEYPAASATGSRLLCLSCHPACRGPLSRYQEPSYPGTSTTWQQPPRHRHDGSMSSVTIAEAARAGPSWPRSCAAAGSGSARSRPGCRPGCAAAPPGCAGRKWPSWPGSASPGTPGWSRAARSTPAPRCWARWPRRSGWTRPSGSTCTGWPTCRTPRPTRATVPCPQVPPEVQAIMDGLVPMPACVLNERYDLLGWNEAYAALWPGVTGAAPGERNILWLNFTYPDCCHPYVSRHEQLGRLVAQFRGNYGRHVGEPELDRVHRAAAGGQPALRQAVGRARRGQPGQLHQGLPAPGVRPAGHDHDQLRRAVRARHPDGGLHTRPTRHAGPPSASCWPARAPTPSTRARPRTPGAAPNWPPPPPA